MKRLSSPPGLVASLLVLSSLGVLAGPSIAKSRPTSLTDEVGFIESPKDGPIDFNRDIRPLLSDRCFKCHGFDANARQAGLRLDTWDGLSRPVGDRLPVVPFEPSRSELVSRIHSNDLSRVMPPPKSQLILTNPEKALLTRWIEEGAQFEGHWAFLPPSKTNPPADSTDTWSRSEIDRFVFRRLRQNGLSPSQEADRETLIRRASLDLTGLPPTPEDIDTFLKDEEPKAYERLVERLLASEHFGERLALMWLDAARYADTNGFHHDNVRTSWPYRDWVIGAFNENMPFDQFLTEQIAGDLLDDATEQQRIATAFCRMHNINDEGGALDPEYRVEAIADRIETISTVFMGLTFTCARCHDHKYDPITQEDYYSLFAYFNSVDERGVYPADFEQARAYPARLLYSSPSLKEEIRTAENELREAKDNLAKAEPSILKELSNWERRFRSRRDVAWIDTQLEGANSKSGSLLERLTDGSIRVSGKTPSSDVHHLTFNTSAVDLNMLRFEALSDPSHPNGSTGLHGNGNSVITSVRLVATSLKDPEQSLDVKWAWAWADHEQPNGDFDVLGAIHGSGHGWALGGHENAEDRTALFIADKPFGFPGGTLLDVFVGYESRYPSHIVGRPRVTFAKTHGDVLPDFPRVLDDWFSIGPFEGSDFNQLYDEEFGPETLNSMDRDQQFHGQSWRHRPDLKDGVVHSFNAERSAYYFARSVRTPLTSMITLSLGSDDAIRVYCNGNEVHGNKAQRGAAADQDRVTFPIVPGDNVIVVKIINDGGPGGFFAREIQDEGRPGALSPVAFLDQKRRNENLQERFVASWGKESSPTYARLRDRVELSTVSLDQKRQQSVPVLIMKDNENPTPTFVLDRGQYDSPNEQRPVQRRTPSVFDGVVPHRDGAPKNRLDFARWLLSKDHPLTARVHVNRIWQMIFGVGLVATSENFGQQSEWPSHPAMLDWLAVRFIDSGWDHKALLRSIVTSSTYRQSSKVIDEAKRIDPNNRMLAYFPRQRLQGEMIRDQALYVSGLLSDEIGGPSARPYQPEGLWREVSIGASSNTQVFKRDFGNSLYRRSIYTFWKRTSPNPQMQTFDVPTREYCVVRRNTTNTPLQALVLWNDEQFVEASRKLAERALMEESNTQERLSVMFRRSTGRIPETRELLILEETLNEFLERFRASREDAIQLLEPGESNVHESLDPVEVAAWTMLGTTLLSLDETIVRD